MKNMFKMMGVALLAGAMLFTACKKDENTTNNGNNTPTPTVTVTLNGETWSNSDVIDHETYGVENNLHTFYIYRNNDEYVEMGVTELVADVEQSYTVSSNYLKYWTATDEYSSMVTTGSLTLTAVDINAKTISANINAQFVDGGVQRDLNVLLNNAQWKDATK